MSGLLGMSDDDFMKLSGPGSAPVDDGGDAPVVEEGNENQDEITNPEPEAQAEDQGEVDGTDGDHDNDAAGSGDDAGEGDDAGGADKASDAAAGDAPHSGSADGADAGDPDPTAGKTDAAAGTDKTVAGDKAGEPGKDGAEPAVKPDAKDAGGEGDKPVDYEAFFKQVMSPLKANGKDYTPRTPEEAIRLMQMGAGFGRKLQDLQPHLKTLRMLEKENLLDPAELSFLIDVRNKNPDAIKKIIKDANIDPLDLNIEDNVSYTPVDRSVSDAEMKFGDVVSSVSAREGGSETIQHINRTWDQQSLGLLWEQPALLETFHEQRESGAYDKIVAEIERQKVFGTIAPDTPFVQAYLTAGNALQQSGGLGLPPSPDPAKVTETQPAPQPKVVATRTQPPKPVANNDKANAAAPSRTNPKKASAIINPLEMADEDFMKQFQGRL